MTIALYTLVFAVAHAMKRAQHLEAIANMEDGPNLEAIDRINASRAAELERRESRRHTRALERQRGPLAYHREFRR